MFQARDKILNHKNHIANHPCDKCDIAGTRLVVKPAPVDEFGNQTRPAVKFNFFPWTPGVTEHHDGKVRDLMTNPEYSQEERLGFKGWSCVLRLNNFDLVKNIPCDPMHQLYLGTTKRMFGQTFKINHPSIPLKRLLIRRGLRIDQYNEVTCRQKQPSEMNRRARDIDFCNYKASEWKTLVLCNSIHIIDIAAETDLALQQCWIMYFWIIRTYVVATNDELDAINVYLDMPEFIRQFKLLYEKVFSKFACSYNIHVLEHLPNQRQNGPLVNDACYAFEGSFATMINSLCKGTRNVTRQANRGTFCAYRGRRGEHTCQMAIKYRPFKEKSAYDDSLAYTRNGFWCVKEVNVKDKRCRCARLNIRPITYPCKHAPRNSLNLSLIGVYKYHSVDPEITQTFHFSDFLGKLMKVGSYVVKLPKEILLECT